MDCTSGEALDDTTLAEHRGLDDIVVCQHREDRIAPTRVRDRDGLLGPFSCQRCRFRRRAIVNGDLMAGLQQVRRHGRAHLAQPDETNFHYFAPSNVSAALNTTALTRSAAAAERSWILPRRPVPVHQYDGAL